MNPTRVDSLKMVDENKKYPEGHFLGVGMAIGIAIFSGVGIALSTSIGNPGLIGIGPALGVGIGLAIGKSIEDKYKKQGLIRPLTRKEEENRRKGQIFGLIAAIAGMLALISFLVFRYFT
jgi:hypothetical protein